MATGGTTTRKRRTGARDGTTGAATATPPAKRARGTIHDTREEAARSGPRAGGGRGNPTTAEPLTPTLLVRTIADRCFEEFSKLPGGAGAAEVKAARQRVVNWGRNHVNTHIQAGRMAIVSGMGAEGNAGSNAGGS